MFVSMATVLIFYFCVVSCVLASGKSDGANIILELKGNLTLFHNRLIALEEKFDKAEKERNKTVVDLSREKEALKNHVSALYKDKIEEQQRIFSLEKGFLYLNKTWAEQNQTMRNYRDIILSLEQDLNRTKADYEQAKLKQQRMMSSMERDLNRTKADQENRLLLLSNKMMTAKVKTTNLQQQFNSFRTFSSTVQYEINNTLTDIYDTNTRMEHNIKKIEEVFNQSISAHDRMLHDAFSTTTNIRNNITTLGKQVQYGSLALADNVKKLQAINSSLQECAHKVAFTVSRTRSASTPLSYQKVIYDKIITNIGSVYSTETGVFTCPSSGQYMFTWSTFVYNQACYLYIYKNGDKLLLSDSEVGNNYPYKSSSNTIILSLVTGDKVWTETDSCESYYGYPHTAFSGVKL